MWTTDSLFLRPTLNIPIDKQNIQEDSLNSSGDVERLNGNPLDRSFSTASTSSAYLNGNGSLNSSTSSSTLSSTATPSGSSAAASSKEHNNNLDYKISLNDIQPDLANDCDKPSTSQQNGSNEMLKAKDESMDDFLSRIDQYIKQSKVKMDSFANTSEIIISSKSDDNIFQHLHNYNSKSFRQHSLRNNDICLGEIRDKQHNHENREIVYSLRKLEKEQEEREKYEL